MLLLSYTDGYSVSGGFQHHKVCHCVELPNPLISAHARDLGAGISIDSAIVYSAKLLHA